MSLRGCQTRCDTRLVLARFRRQLVIDIALVRTDPDLVRRTVRLRRSDVDVDKLIEVDAELRHKRARLEQLRAERKRQGKGEVDIEVARALKVELQRLTEEVRALQKARDSLWARVPNLLADDTPPGRDEGSNVELRREGEPPPAAERRAHDLVGVDLGILDLARAAEVAGSGFYYWRGEGARLAWAVFSYALDFLTQRGFQPMLTPLVARDEVFFGTGYLPFFADEQYRLQRTDLSLIGTSEQTLIGYYGDSILKGNELPILLTGFSACFRTEAGAAGKANRGAFRAHQFHKVEQIVICEAEASEHWLNECQRNAEELLRGLELPFRVVRVCVGDLGAPVYKKYDTETWFPSFGTYKETHSNSNLADYQARRFRIRYRRQGKTVFPHTISATAITDRPVLAIMENHLQDDGSILIPKLLRPYFGGQERITRRDCCDR
jgi:seryl-tRNA synthetase